jgi:fatty acid desaturase
MQERTDGAQDKTMGIEWQTIVIIVFCYGCLVLLMWFYYLLPFWVIMPIAGYLIALHGSLQHEALHGHPTRNGLVNEVLVFINPSFWFPYRRYRKLHLTHHNDDHLTCPSLDPESYYMLPDEWAQLPSPLKQIYIIHNTLAGRMVLGPIIGTARFWIDDFYSIIKGDFSFIKCWVLHIPACAITLAYAYYICGIPVWAYLVMFAWPGVAFSLVRSFCEHQAVKNLGERTIVVEASPLLSLMFLNNNLHLAHHRQPRMAWYKLPAYYHAEREALLKENNGYIMHGYWEIFRRYFLKPKEPVAYPDTSYLK